MALVSFCIPARNASAYIEMTLRSILDQTYCELEVIVIDDHSEDNTVAIIKQFSDTRLKLHLASKYGASAARNEAYRLAKGKYIIFFDADDWIPADFLESQMKTLKSEDDVVLSTWGRFVNGDIRTFVSASSEILEEMTFKKWIIKYWSTNTNMTCPGRVLSPKKVIEKTGLWDESLTLNDDFPFFTSVFLNAKKININNKSNFYYRSGVGGLSSLNSNLGLDSLYRSIVLAIECLPSDYFHDEKIKKSCANLLQSFVYKSYPRVKKSRKKAELQIKAFGGADLLHDAGGLTAKFNYIFGWKCTKIIKNKVKNLKHLFKKTTR